MGESLVTIGTSGGGGAGTPGTPGTPGKSAYQLAVDAGFVGTQAQWLASLKGNPGDPGNPGPPGADSTVPGPPGNPGAKGDKGDMGIPGLAGMPQAGTLAIAAADNSITVTPAAGAFPNQTTLPVNFKILVIEGAKTEVMTVTSGSTGANGQQTWTVLRGAGQTDEPVVATRQDFTNSALVYQTYSAGLLRQPRGYVDGMEWTGVTHQGNVNGGTPASNVFTDIPNSTRTIVTDGKFPFYVKYGGGLLYLSVGWATGLFARLQLVDIDGALGVAGAVVDDTPGLRYSGGGGTSEYLKLGEQRIRVAAGAGTWRFKLQTAASTVAGRSAWWSPAGTRSFISITETDG